MTWAIELSEFDITFEPRGTIRAHMLADFVNELHPPGVFSDHLWTMYVDGSVNSRRSRAGIVIEGPDNLTLEQALKF